MNKLTNLIYAIEEFRKLDPEFPIQIAVTLLAVAAKPGITNNELTLITGMSKAATSRNVTYLTKEYGKYPFVVYTEDPADRRQKCARLSAEGERFVAGVLHRLGD